MKDRQPHTKTHHTPGKRREIAFEGTQHTSILNTSSSSLSLPGSVQQRLGAVLLAIVIGIVIVATLWPDRGPGPLTVVTGYGGELKVNFFEDPEIARILAEEYGLEVDITGVGSVDLACGMPLGEDDDFVWLGDSVALARYRNLGCTMLRADNVYNSPIVLYSWTPVVDSLVAAGVAQTTEDGAFTLDFAQLVDLMMEEATWADIGLTDLHGGIIVQTTDPNRSNSGLLYSGLLANTLNGGTVVNSTTVIPLLPDIQAYFDRLGLMEATSGNLFEQFLITGMGAKPMVALYESQIQEFLHSNPSYAAQITEQVRIIYPQPTVWATHPFVARNEDASRLLDALKDPEIQRLAWEHHGQRPGVPGVDIDPDAIPVPGIVPEITSVTSMPSPETMDLILAAIAGTLPSGTPAPMAAPLAPVTVLAFGARCWSGEPPNRRLSHLRH
jgi:hypothetical protein